MSKLTLFLLFSFVLVGCNASGEVSSNSPGEPIELDTPQSTTVIPPPTQTTTPDPFPDPTIKIIGEEEIVFDWTTDRCWEENFPDLAARAFRDATGQVQLLLSHPSTYRMIGPDLNNLVIDCSSPVNQSANNRDPGLFSDKEWISSVYTEDGQTIYALVHNEYQGHTHPGQCPQNDYFSCLSTTITSAISTDSGQSFQRIAEIPDHFVAGLPYPYEAGAGAEGTRAPSNLIKGQDGYYYSYFNVSGFNSDDQWVCAMRTDDLNDPASWRFWDGSAFNGRFINPYLENPANPLDHQCAPLDQLDIGHDLANSVNYSSYLERYVLIGISADHLDGREVWGFYYSFSYDLVDWTRRKLLVEIELPWTVEDSGRDISYLYPSLLDPDSSSRSFETVGETAYLYFTRNNFGHGSLDRDLVRVPVQFFPSD